jgi:hypothetical protein
VEIRAFVDDQAQADEDNVEGAERTAARMRVGGERRRGRCGRWGMIFLHRLL